MFISRGQIMNSTPFSQELQARIAKYDLLSHPFYKAWSAGELSRDDLREYACQYYHHVAAFPAYLAQFAVRLEDGALRQAVMASMAGEKARLVRDMYSVDENACRYFALHTTADIYHAQVWRQQLENCVESNPGATQKALGAAEAAAKALWRALDGIEAMRLAPTT